MQWLEIKCAGYLVDDYCRPSGAWHDEGVWTSWWMYEWAEDRYQSLDRTDGWWIWLSRRNREETSRVIVSRCISQIDNGDWFTEDIRRYESGVTTGRWISGGQIQRPPGAEDALRLLGGESGFKR